ncbi:MAG TPA: hypothetical protein EYP55_11775 [Anaerolineae bacterium]|nr:hypothetical protein [Anaerolineae bacterium]
MTTAVNPERLELDDLEWFIRLGGLVGFRQFGFDDIRARQDAELTERLRQRALARIQDPQLIQVTDDSFFLGSVDYMVRETPDGQKGYTVLETNGGSSRGLTLLSPPDVERLMAAFVEMLRFLDPDEPPLILVGHPDGDALITEKFLTIYRLKEALERERPGLKVRVLSINAFRTLRRAGESEAVIVLSPHSQSALSLHLQDDRVYLMGRRVHLIIGDGAVARHHQLGRRRSDMVLANWIFPVTGDKFSTYQAIERARDILIPHGLYPLRFWRAWSREELERICEEKRSEVDGLIIKPFQGSGGAGVLPVLPGSSVPEVVEESLGEFHAKYGHRNSPFPYTVCEKINPRKATWRGNRHNYDIRIYVARQGDTLIPVGCLFRIAPQPDKGTYSKGSLIVNLSGYGGIAVERGLGLSEESLETVHLEEEDIVKIFAASTLLMAAITRQPIDWSQRQRPV